MARKKAIESQENLIKFMQAKSNKMKELGCPTHYFIKNDADAIRKWNKKDSDDVWKKIGENENLKGFSATSCPYCILHKDCDSCEYAKIHGRCDIGDFNSITNFFKSKDISIYTIFDSNFYKKLVKELKGNKKGNKK